MGRVAPLKKPTHPKVATLKKLLTKAITDILDDSVEETDLEGETQKTLEKVDTNHNVQWLAKKLAASKLIIRKLALVFMPVEIQKFY